MIWRAVRYGNAAFETSSVVVAARMSRARGPQSPKATRDDVTSLTSTLPSVGACFRIQARSWLPNAVPVTSRNRSGAVRVTVRSHSMPPRRLSSWV